MIKIIPGSVLRVEELTETAANDLKNPEKYNCC